MKARSFRDDTSHGTASEDAREALQVVIAYNDLAAAKRAMRVLANLDQGLGDAIEFQPLPWPFELLTDLDWRDAALRDAISANILIIATSAPGPLPPAMERWVEFTASQKLGTDAAIVALFGSEDKFDDIGSSRLAAIHTVAQRTGLDFFAPAACGELSELTRSIQQPAETVMPLTHQFLYPYHPPPHWGINE